MEGLVISIAVIVAIVVAFFIGKFGAKFSRRIEDKKIKKNAEEVIAGKRANKTEIDGKEIEVNKFIVRDEKGEEVITQFKEGGVSVEKAHQKVIEKEKPKKEKTSKSSKSNKSKKARKK